MPPTNFRMGRRGAPPSPAQQQFLRQIVWPITDYTPPPPEPATFYIVGRDFVIVSGKDNVLTTHKVT